MLQWLKNWFLRFIGFERVNRITIEESALQDILDMAKSSYPKEVLVFLSATEGNKKGHVHIDEIQIQAYEASQTSAMVWLHLLPTVSNIVGTAHSHPSGSRRPSRADLQFWSKQGFVHMIAGRPYTRNSVSFYNKQGEEIGVGITRNI